MFPASAHWTEIAGLACSILGATVGAYRLVRMHRDHQAWTRADVLDEELADLHRDHWDHEVMHEVVTVILVLIGLWAVQNAPPPYNPAASLTTVILRYLAAVVICWMSLASVLMEWRAYRRRHRRRALGWGVVIVLMWSTPAGAQTLPMGFPDLCAGPTVSSVTAGAWSNPATWSAGVPSAGARVRVAHDVAYDVRSDAAVACVGVTGALRFSATATTRLTVQTLLIYPSGTLEIGTAARPIPSNLVAELVWADVPINTGLDPEQVGNGLMGFGTVTIHGAPRAPTWRRLAVEPTAGATTLTLAGNTDFPDEPIDPIGWQPGDVLVLPGTQIQWYRDLEYPSIKAISGRTVTLAAPLVYTHRGARNAAGALELLPHVGNLGRSVIVRSANAAGTRGHGILTGDAAIDIRYAAFQNMGRTLNTPLDLTTFGSGGAVTHIGTNQIGRYPIHLHMMNRQGAQVIGNVVQGSRRWGITVHGTHYHRVANNVVVDAQGAGIALEDGSETGNLIERNFIVRVDGLHEWAATRGTTTRDMGFEGVGIWARCMGSTIRDNVTAMIRLYGYTYFCHSMGMVWVPAGQGSTQKVSVAAIAVPASFSNNEVYASNNGFTGWYINASGPNIGGGPGSVFRRLKIWHVERYGIYWYHSYRMIMEDLVIRGDKQALIANANLFNRGIFFSDYPIMAGEVRRADIQGMRVGMDFPVLMGPYGGPIYPFRLTDSYFANYYGVLVEPMWTVAGTKGLPPKQSIVSNTRFDVLPGVSGAHGGLVMNYKAAQHNLIQKDEVLVYNHQRVTGDHFQAYYGQQAPTFIVPQSGSGGYYNLVGSPVAGLTNAQNWATYGIAIGGAVAPCAGGKAMLSGFGCGISGTIPPPITPPTVPALTMGCPPNQSAMSTDGQPVVLSYPPPTIAGGTPPTSVSCAPTSGAAFPIGSTPVSCAATDSKSVRATCGFSVGVTEPAKPPPEGSQTFKAGEGFSSTQGVNGWNYLTTTGPMAAFDASANTWKAADPYAWIWNTGGNPGAAVEVIRRFTVPFSGQAQITIPLHNAQTCGDGIIASVRHNGVSVATRDRAPGQPLETITLNRDLAAGDQLDFALADKSNNTCDSTYYEPVIILTAPATGALEPLPKATNFQPIP